MLHSHGDPEWYLHNRKSVIVKCRLSRIAEQRLLCDRIPIRPPPRSLRVAAPSTVGQSFEPVPLEKSVFVQSERRYQYGDDPACVSSSECDGGYYAVDRVELRRIALAAVSPEELRHVNIDHLIDEFEGMLQSRSVRQALGKQRYRKLMFGHLPQHVEIDNERAVNLVMNDRLISGTIDRLVLLMRDGKPYAAEIIDFKTDAYDDSMTLLWVQDRIDHHRPQLEIYAKVVSELFDIPDENIATHLVLLTVTSSSSASAALAPLSAAPPSPRPRAPQAKVSN